MGSKLDVDFAGDWRSLFVYWLALMREMRLRTRPDPQYLGFVNPRLSDVAADLCTDYVEAMEYIKLLRLKSFCSRFEATNKSAVNVFAAQAAIKFVV